MLSEKLTKAIAKLESASRMCGMGEYDPRATDAKIEKHEGMAKFARAALTEAIEYEIEAQVVHAVAKGGRS